MSLTIAKFDRYDLVNTPCSEKPAFTIWFSGCSQKCAGCYNQKLWDANAGKKHEVNIVMFTISKQREYSGVDDIVFLGGEPMEQDSTSLMQLAQKLYNAGFHIWLYTSWDIDEIPDEIKQYVYTIKCGRYDESLKCDGIPSSTNQAFYRRNDSGEWQQITLGGSTT